MTVNDIYEAALSLESTLREQDDSLRPHALQWVNIFLAETLFAENSILKHEGKPRLLAAPLLADMAEEVPYHDELVRIAAPYYVASQILKDDDNNAWASRYYDMYYNALREAIIADMDFGIDVWGGEE